MRKLVLVSVIFGSLLAAPSANAAIPSALGVTCNVAGDGVRECGTGSSSGDTVRSTAPTWDSTPIDVNIAFPPVPGGTDGDYPLVIVGHGFGGEKIGFGTSSGTNGLRRFTSRGYAVFSMTDRGFHQSCGKDNAISAAPAGACDAGFIHLMDDRFEVRDAQFFAGELADEGLADGQRVGAIGGSYGGGLSMALASLKDRVMMPDGSLVPWTSPVNHEPMRIAGAAPDIPWTDLAYSLVPNGGTLDYVADSSYNGRIGIQKQSLVNGLFISGSVAGKYCGQAPYPACTDPDADLQAWKSRLDAGEPYDGDPVTEAAIAEIKAHHSSYYIDHSVQPAPLMISNGFTDDLFPADEAIRYYNRIRSLYPNAPISLFFGDFGHQRSANKSADSSARDTAQNAWLDYYVKGTGSLPFQGATAFAMTCPSPTPSGGPFQAGSWAGLQKGQVRLTDNSAKTIAPGGGSQSVDATWDPVSAGGNPCTSASSADLPGVATYRLPPATGSGYTLMGSPTIVAKIDSPVANSELAARLLDVAPGGTETLVDRQLFRPLAGSARQVFQLHPSGHLFAAGHVAKLELLPRDSGGSGLNSYGRAANGQGAITVSKLDFRLPVLESPGSAGGQVKGAAPLPLPCGMGIAPAFSSVSYLRASLGDAKVKAKGKTVKVPVDSAPGSNPCSVRVEILGSGKGTKGRSAKKRKKSKVLGRRNATIGGGQSSTLKVKLSKHGRSAVRRGRSIRVQVTTVDAAGDTVQVSKVKLSHGKKHKKHKKK
jgi:Acetyl xylan esterase (AXE1)